MTGIALRRLSCGLGLAIFAAGLFGHAPAAKAQFFWSPWFQEQQGQAKKPKARAPKPKAPTDDLPPIVPKESSAPPPPDDRPYDPKLLRLAEILGAVHYLRELCGAQEGQLWRNQMKDVLKNEGSTAVRRAKLVNSFNDGYRGYRRTYRTCNSSATLAITRFSSEGAQIAVALANPSSAYASRNAPAEAVASTGAGEGATAPAQANAGGATGAATGASPANSSPTQANANANAAAPAGQAQPAAQPGQPAPTANAAPASGAAGQTPDAAAKPVWQPPEGGAQAEGTANPDAAAAPAEPQAKKKKKRVQRKKPVPQQETGFFFRH
jgi:uncharacterized protein (TIGR02301 family)